MTLNLDDHAKTVIDIASVSTVLGTLAGMLPSIAALFSIGWSIIRIYETKTVQGLIQKYKNKAE